MEERKVAKVSTGKSLHDESGSDSLLKLKSELRKAYILKSLKAQMTEKKAQRMSEDIQERLSNDLMNISIEASLAEEHRKRKDCLRHSEEYKHQLEKQILEKERNKILEEEKEKYERRVLIEVDRVRELEEKQKSVMRKVDLADRLIREGQICQEMKEIIRDRKAEREVKEDIKNREYTIEIEERSTKLEEMKREQAARRIAVIDVVVQTMIDLEWRKTERQQELLVDLATEEMQQEALIQATEEKLRRKKMLEELVTGLKEQIAFEEECRRRFAEREKDFEKTVMMKIMESDRIEKLTKEMRKRKRIEYRKDLELLMQERKMLREKELSKIKESIEAERQREEIFEKKRKEEKKQLLQIHAGIVGNFINKKILTPEEKDIVAENMHRN